MSPSWRDNIKVHPAADLFPMMSEVELDELAADIATNGLHRGIVWIGGSNGLALLDGRNRVAAVARIADEKRRAELQTILRERLVEILPSSEDPIAYVISANLHRRHLTREQKRDLIAKLLETNPEKSDRAIAKTAKASHHTVATVRAKAEVGGQIAHHDTRTGADGVAQPARKAPSKTPAAKMPSAVDQMGAQIRTLGETAAANREAAVPLISESGYRGNQNGSQQLAAAPVIAEPPSPEREPPIDPVAEICRMAADVQARVAALPKILPDERKRLLTAFDDIKQEIRYIGQPAKTVAKLRSGAERQRRHRERHPEREGAAA